MLKRMLWALVLAALSVASFSVAGQERGRGRGAAVTLPDGPGRDIVQAQCASCHALNLITNSGYSRAEWTSVFSTMVALLQDQAATVADYLAKNYPEKPRPPAVIIPGSASVSIKEWIVPSLGSRPHDPLATPDGAIWWTGQFASVIGRLDPKTGEVKEWPSPSGPKSQPYGITSIHDVIWYSESAVKPNTVVRFDPKTEKFQTWAIPSGGGVVRNVSVTRDGNLALACSGVNRVALVEIKDGRKGP